MSGIVLSASVRQNLLSLQSTADLLSTTQNRLATGNKVNSALDNPTNFFTAQGLDNRASDINNLLDSIGNGVQVLQAANTGITSLQKLVDTAKSIANQALQATTGYSTKSKVTTASLGATATASNLLGTGADTPATAGTVTAGAFTAVNVSGTGAAATAGTLTAGAFTALNVSGTGSAATAATVAEGTFGTVDLSTTGTIAFTVNIDGTDHAISLDSTITAVDKTQVTGQELADAINAQIGGGSTAASFTAGKLSFTSGTTGSTSSVTVTGTTGSEAGNAGIADSTIVNGTDTVAADALSFDVTLDGGAAKTITLSAASVSAYNTAKSASLSASSLSATDVASLINYQVDNSGATTVATVSGGNLVFTSSTTGASSSIATSAVTGSATSGSTGVTAASDAGSAAGAADSLAFTVTVDGGTAKNVSISKATVDAYNTANSTTFDSSALTNANVAALINDQVGSSVATVGTGGNLVFASSSTGATSTIATSAVTAAGAATNTTGIAVGSGTGADLIPGSTLNGKTLSIASTAGGTATTVTFGTGAGKVDTLDELNAALASNNLTASLGSDGALTFTTTNDYASSTIGAFTGTATGAGNAFGAITVSAPVADANAQNTRATLVSQYNTVIDQIKTTAQDSSFNGVNLLNGDQLKLVFNETGKSTLTIQGVTFDPAGLGLSSLTSGTDFLDNASTNKVLSSLNDASSTLRSQASTLGSNLSIVQIRQDFSKNLINVLQTGSSNLTLADTNEEAANSQALSTRQSIAVSALALANQSNQSVLQLLR